MKGSFIFLLFVTVFTDTTKGMGCDTGEEVAAKCNCTFDDQTEMCCWQNKSKNFQWIKHSYDQFVSATGDNSIMNDVARLESTEICASVNVQYSLTFRYKLEDRDEICQLTVYSKVDGSTLWRTNTSTEAWEQTPALNFTSPQKTKIRIDVIKSTNRLSWCRVSLDDIVIGHENITPSSTPLSPTTSLTPATTTVSSSSSSPSQSSPSSSSSSSSSPSSTSSSSSSTSLTSLSSSASSLSSSTSSSTPQTIVSPSRTPTMTSALTTDAADQTGDKDGVPAGAIVGIVIALIVLVIVCVVVILLIKRRGEGQAGLASFIFKKFGKPQNKTKAGDHSAITRKDDIIAVDNKSSTSSVPRGTASNGRLQHSTSPYEIADIPDSSNYYNVLVDEDGTHAVRPTNKTKTQSSDYDLATIVESGGDYSTVDDADLEERRARARPDEYAKVKKPKGGNYNKLSFQNPGFDGKGEDTYNHIQDEEPVYKVPRSDDNEYSLATNPGASSAGHYAGGGIEPHYVIVDGKGKDEAARGGDDEYNHLNLGKDPSANVLDSTDRGTGDGVYNHLDDQNQGPPGVQTEDTYNKVNYDGHTQDQNRKQNAGDYSHIGGF